MITSKNAMGYEISSILLVVLMIFIVQMITGPLFFWIIWLYSVSTVALGFLDHVCTEWKLRLDVQGRRIALDLITCIPAGILLYYSLYFLLPDINFKSMISIINGVQQLIRMSSAYGWFMYAYIYFLFHVMVLSFIRIFMNIGYLIFMGINEAYPIIDMS